MQPLKAHTSVSLAALSTLQKGSSKSTEQQKKLSAAAQNALMAPIPSATASSGSAAAPPPAKQIHNISMLADDSKAKIAKEIQDIHRTLLALEAPNIHSFPGIKTALTLYITMLSLDKTGAEGKLAKIMEHLLEKGDQATKTWAAPFALQAAKFAESELDMKSFEACIVIYDSLGRDDLRAKYLIERSKKVKWDEEGSQTSDSPFYTLIYGNLKYHHIMKPDNELADAIEAFLKRWKADPDHSSDYINTEVEILNGHASTLAAQRMSAKAAK